MLHSWFLSKDTISFEWLIILDCAATDTMLTKYSFS